MFSFFPSRSTICNNNNTKCRTTRKNPENFFLFSARENLHICYHLKTRRNDEVNAAADAKRDEAEEINIFIALPGGTNASTKFKSCDCVSHAAAKSSTVQTTTCAAAAMMIVSRCESLDPYLKREWGLCHA